ncbi:DUF4335 domain-containing protein [Sphaerospermopsis kisseleviana CS-549]|uniref:DUF4335 domain-containing protein n=1 Tax=Sphaerospermopsis kisseleviana CS-549 TaxID=3021783 RepID=A0ABT4ZXP6_9CYAN|nr:DUF4335 domain-containing protein [Sphaerospermopsis kisseleviana]MDB9444207.1 DUF4335 domain-containing protein [Sphaerospermopsis kisseleviana CS-549]BAZ80345.1 hypothetical protein NIES73_15980 [Sphaerospermopsis kisseleviana NIES-73]
MNIQRKYSLPNCTLLLEGLSDVAPTTQFQELRPELSILVNAECYLSSYSQPITGGREFFESLVRAVSAYAQEFLSNVPNPQAHNGDSELVELQKIDSNRHKLIVHSEITGDGLQSQSNAVQQSPIQIDLNTVQLFDLVEAVDQFFADTQTLPELTLELQPVTRRYHGASQTIIKQAVPATVGVSSLAVAAVAFSLIPPPQVRPPEPKQEEQTSTAIPTASPTPTSEASPTASATPIIKDLEALLNTVPEITDPSQLRALNRQVYNQIHPVWENRSEITEDLVYRLGVAGDGSIVGYKAVNKNANDAIEKTPLPKLLYNPANRTVTNEPIAQFRVVFTRQGVLEISPWLGYTRTPDVIGEKITDSSTLKDLNQKLYNTIRQNWSVTPTFNRELRYRVAVNKIGVIADYEPLNQVAFDYFRETPLPQMFQSVYGSNQAAPNNKEPLAHFQVVFKSNGTLEVTPWQGYR